MHTLDALHIACSSAIRVSFVDSVWLECELLSATDTHYNIRLKDADQQTGLSP
jgi:hypothetical protein